MGWIIIYHQSYKMRFKYKTEVSKNVHFRLDQSREMMHSIQKRMMDAIEFLFRDDMIKTSGSLVNKPAVERDNIVDNIEIEFVLFHPDDWDKLVKDIATISPEAAGTLLLTENKKRL